MKINFEFKIHKMSIQTIQYHGQEGYLLPPQPQQQTATTTLMSERGLSPFFEEIYSCYNQIWQEVTKIPCLPNTNMIPTELFLNALMSAGISVNDPYCLFLIDTCSIRVDRVLHRESSRKALDRMTLEERVIDYKIFFSTCIKSKIAIYKAPFNDENFIIDHFWRCKFPTSIVPGLRSPSPELLIMDQIHPVSAPHSPIRGQKHQKVPLEIFNQAFYQFFNRDAQLLEIDQIQAILNDCFQYLLKKNKKHISKRTFRTVITRQFKFLFPMIIHRYHKLSSEHTKSTDTNNGQQRLLHSADRQILNEIFQKQSINSDSLYQPPPNLSKLDGTTSHIVNDSTVYPDSLDTRGGSIKQASFHQPMATQYQSHHNHSSEVFQTSTFARQPNQQHPFTNSSSVRPQEISTHEMDGVFKLFNALSRVRKRLSLQKTMLVLLKFTKRAKKHAKISTIELCGKENQNPQQWQDSLNAALDPHQKSRTMSIKNQLQLNKNTSTTFSFNNTGNQEENLHVNQQNYQSHQRLHQYDPYQDEPLFNITKKNSAASNIGSKQQSIGSLAFSNTTNQERNFANLSSVKNEPSFPGQHSQSQGQQTQFTYQQNSIQEAPQYSAKSSVKDYQPQQPLPQQPTQSTTRHIKPVKEHHLQHHLFKPCEDSSRYSNSSTTHYVIDQQTHNYCGDRSSSQFQLINDINGQPVMGHAATLPAAQHINNSSSFQNDESKSMMTNGTVISTRHSGLHIMPTMPPISSRPGKHQGGRSTKNQRQGMPRGLSDFKCSSTPKMVTTSNLQDLMGVHTVMPVARGGATLQMSAGGASSTIDYSACTVPVSGSSRRPQSHQNRHTIAVSGQQDRLDINKKAQRDLVTIQESHLHDDRYYERKYRKSKRRIRKLLSDHETEKSRLLDIHVNNSSLLNHVNNNKSQNNKDYKETIVSFLKRNALAKKVSSIFSVWKTCSIGRSATLAQRLQHNYILKAHRVFVAWAKCTLRRKLYKEKWKALKLKYRLLGKAITKVGQSHRRISVPLAFQIWKSKIVVKALASQKKKSQMLKIILSLTKLAKVVESRSKLLKLIAFQRVLQAAQTKKSERRYHSVVPDQGRNHPLTQQLPSTQDLSIKFSRSRLQQNLIDGLEKLYPIAKRAALAHKRGYFQRWKYLAYDAIVGQLDQSCLSGQHHQQHSPLCIHSQNLAYAGGANSNTVILAQPRSQSLSQPSFYKTNEGWYPAQQPPMQSTTTTVIYSPSPKVEHNISFKYPCEISRDEGVPQQMEGPPLPYPYQGNGIVTFRSNGSGARDRSNSSRNDSVNYNYPRQYTVPMTVLPARLPYHGNIPTFLDRSTHQQSKSANIRENRSRSHSADKKSQNFTQPMLSLQQQRLSSTDKSLQLNEALAYLKSKVNHQTYKRL